MHTYIPTFIGTYVHICGCQWKIAVDMILHFRIDCIPQLDCHTSAHITATTTTATEAAAAKTPNAICLNAFCCVTVCGGVCVRVCVHIT